MSSIRENKIRSILGKDKEVLDNIPDLSKVTDAQLIDIDRAFGINGVIDDTPKKISLKSKKLVTNDYAELISELFAQDVQDDDEVTGYICFETARRPVDIKVEKALKAMLQVGITPDPKLADAVEDIFATILRVVTQNEFTTCNMVLEAMKDNINGVYEKRIYETFEKLFK